MLEAFDLTGSLRDAAELAGCSHHTVAKHVAARDAGQLTDQAAARPMLIDEFLPKLEEWMEHSQGQDPRRCRARQAARVGLSPVRSARRGARSRRCGRRSRPGGCGCIGRG